jgi:hypothetical protein
MLVVYVPGIQESGDRKKKCHLGALLSGSSFFILWNRVLSVRHKRSFKIAEAVKAGPFSLPSSWFLLRKPIASFISKRTLEIEIAKLKMIKIKIKITKK